MSGWTDPYIMLLRNIHVTFDNWKCTEPLDPRDRPGYHCHRCGAFVTDDAPDYNPRREECGGCAERRLSVEDDTRDGYTPDGYREDDPSYNP